MLMARALVVGWQLPVVLIGWGVAVLATRLGPVLIDLPDLTGTGQVATPLASFAAAACGMLAVFSAGEPCSTVFVTAPRRARVVNLARIVALVVLGALVVSTIGVAAGPATLNTTLALAGESLLAACVVGVRLAWLLPVVHLMAASTVGAATRETLHPWAWILQGEPHTSTVIWSASSLLVALAVWWSVVGRRPELTDG